MTKGFCGVKGAYVTHCWLTDQLTATEFKYYSINDLWFIVLFLIFELNCETKIQTSKPILKFREMFPDSSMCSTGDGSASPEELRWALGCSDTTGHPVFEQTDWDRCPQETQLHPRSGTAPLPTVCAFTRHSQSMCPDEHSLMNYLFIFQGAVCII